MFILNLTVSTNDQHELMRYTMRYTIEYEYPATLL